ncbi:hypothetical protein GC174_16300 [bacterium]|nr:hypothetical protein [bacterium]
MKPLYKQLFALVQVLSCLLCLHLVFPKLLMLNWSGTAGEEAVFVLVFWIVSSLFIGGSVIASVIYSILFIKKEAPLERSKLASGVFNSSVLRLVLSLSSFIGPFFSFMIVSEFYRNLLPIDNFEAKLKAAFVLGTTTFLICLPLTLQMQKTLVGRAREKFPDLEIEE